SRFAARVTGDELRFIDWTRPESKRTSSPANLDESHYGAIMKSKKIFCRKMEAGVSDGLQARIDAATGRDQGRPVPRL
ncbi:MAG TPA: hypothetical protein VK786_02995, partial [bacterium]|nr:hypothetical protein [bacterium]